jgi:hypothetical protein
MDFNRILTKIFPPTIGRSDQKLYYPSYPEIPLAVTSFQPEFKSKISRLTSAQFTFNEYVGSGILNNSKIQRWNSEDEYLFYQLTRRVNGKPKNYLCTSRRGDFIHAGEVIADRKITLDSMRWDPEDPHKFHVLWGAYHYIFAFLAGNYRQTEARKIGNANYTFVIENDITYRKEALIAKNKKSLMTYNFNSGEIGLESDFSLGSFGCMGGLIGLDWGTISDSGNSIILSWGTIPAMNKPFTGIETYDRRWNRKRQLYPGIVHWASATSYDGRDVIYTALPFKFPEFIPKGMKPGDFVEIDVETGKIRLLLSIPKAIGFMVSVPNDREHILLTYLGKYQKDKPWFPYHGEIIWLNTRTGIPLRLCHHLSEKLPNHSEKATQPDSMINRRGDLAVFRSTAGQDLADLFYVAVPNK